MKAFHDKPEIKEEYLNRIRMHRAAAGAAARIQQLDQLLKLLSEAV